MSMTDPIADMLTRIRNAGMAKKEDVDIPASRLKVEIARILQEEGYIRSYRVLDTPPQATLRLTLKYNLEDQFAIAGLRRVSKPGRRVYVSRREIPRVMGGLGISILSTPRGMRTDASARKENLGGELLCYVW